MAEQDKKKKKIVHFQLHEKQAEVFNNDSRFRVVVAGRRFGKTKLSMLEMLAWATKKCQKIWYVAPTYRMAKQIMWNDLKVSVPLEWVTKIRENELSMEFRNGSKIELRGADKPDSLRGVSLDFLVLDEFQDIDPETWKTVLRPTLADRKGHALFIGCVKGDTRVLSDQGLKNIEEFCTNKTPKSLTPIDVNLYGLDKKVNKADNFWNNGVVKTKKIRTAMGFELEASLIHPVWIMSEDHREGFEKMENLKVGTRIAIDRGMEMWGNKSILNGWPERLEKLVSTYRHLKWCDAYRVPKITENANLFYFLGAYLMNGEINEKTSKLYLTMKDVEIFHYFGERTFDIPFVQEKVGSYRWFVESRGAVEFIKFLKLDEDQRLGRLPRWLWNCPRNLVGAFLSGVWDASASVSAKINLTYLSSDRHELIKDIQLLLTNFGIISKRSKLEDGRSQILIRGYNAEMFKDIVQLRSKAKAENIDIFVFSNFYVDTVPCIHALERLRKAVRKHYYYTLLVQFISAIKRGRRHEVSYYGLQTILDDERRYRGETEEFKAIEKTIERHYYWDTIESIEDGECQTYDFTVPESHSFWSNGFISHNTPKGFNELYKLYKLGQSKVRQMRKQWHSWQFPTITSPFIPKAEIDAARKDMDEKSFRQEFCHLPDTKVKLWDGGERAIKNLNIGESLVYVGDDGCLKKCSVIDKRNTGSQAIIKVTLEDGTTFVASKYHKIKFAGHKFSLCEADYLERWENGCLRALKIIQKKYLPTEDCVNITVDSPDHSYLLADGTNNFNCASFESMSGRVYYAFDRKEHIANVEFNPKLPIWVGMDFNIDPMSTVIFQPQPNGQVWAIDEIVQVSSNTDDICAELEKRYYKYQNQVTIYPDPAGSARQHARGESDLDIIREHGFKRIKVRRQHSAVADRVNAVNRLLKTASGEIRLYINPRCKHLIDSFEQTLYIPGSRDVDKSLGVEHSADAAGYCIELEFPLRKFVPAGFSR